MHGILFGELKKFVDTHFCGSSWQRIQKEAGLEGTLYTPVHEYPDEEFFVLFSLVAKESGQDIQLLLMLLGQFIVPDLLTLYRRQIGSQQSVMQLLSRLEETIHAVVRLRNPAATPPELRITQRGTNTIVIHYSSKRKLCSLGIGLIEGLAVEYGEPLQIRHNTCMLHGDSECVIEVALGEEKREAEPPLQPLLVKKQPAAAAEAADDADENAPLVIVGAGLVGIHAAKEALRKRPGVPVRIYGDEPWEPYNRVRLSDLLSGDAEWSDIATTLELTSRDRIALLVNNRVRKIDPANKLITEADGRLQPYSHLLLATGSWARPADTQGKKLFGVFTYRNIDDTHAILTRAEQSQGIVILGGGIMGIEVAFALKQQNPDVKVTLVHRNSHLMNRELDGETGGFLLLQVEKAGIQVVLNAWVAEYVGDTDLEQVRLSDGQLLACDMLIACTGIIPNAELAREAGLDVGRGIRVSQHMQTSDPWIYAAGECVEYNGRTYGSLAPGVEQASVAVDNILRGNQRLYRDSITSMQAKIKHLPVYALCSSEQRCDEAAVKISWRNDRNACFRQLSLCHGRLVGARAVGEWGESAIVQQAIDSKARIWPWRRQYFIRYGSYSPDSIANNLANLHHSAVICACGGVTCGELVTAAAKGGRTLEGLSLQTGAGQGCGSCRPLLAQFAGGKAAAPLPQAGFSFLLFSLTAALLPFFTALPEIPAPQSVLETATLPALLEHPLFKQISGYAVLLPIIFSHTLSINKRFRRLNFLHYTTWRAVHAGLAAAAGLIFLFHANFNAGERFSLQMLLLFAAVAITGLSLSVSIALERSFFGFAARKYRSLLLHMHCMAVVIFFVYILVHIAAAYCF